MKPASAWRTIVVIWLCWAIILLGYQAFVRARFRPMRPDTALYWTATVNDDIPTNPPYLNSLYFRIKDHIAWDSYYYLFIAQGGYENPDSQAIPRDYNQTRNPQVSTKGQHPDWISLNYAFLPFYPALIRILAIPMKYFNSIPYAAESLAGVLISILGTLGAMIGLYYLARDELGESGGVRAAFYLVIFPAGMFLAQIYTEGLFLGLSFGALALMRRKKWIMAASLAVCATWTRSVGVLLLIPMALYWWSQGHFKDLLQKQSWKEYGKVMLVGSPVVAYLIWNAFLGAQFRTVESLFFHRGILLIDKSVQAWGDAWKLFLSNPQSQAYYLVEFMAILFGLASCILMLRKRDWPLALYSLAVIIAPLTSGEAQGMHRYVMAAPVIFLLAARLGENQSFDRAWTLGNILLMGVFAAMFTFNFWAG